LRDEEKETLEWKGVVRRRWKENRRRRTVKVKVKFKLNVKNTLKYYFKFLIFLLKNILVNVFLVWVGRRSHRGGARRSCLLVVMQLVNSNSGFMIINILK